jgi:hypothetical protein
MNAPHLRATLTVVLAVIVVVALLLVGSTSASAQGTDPASVVAAFDTALNAGNVEATLALFAEDGVVRTQSGTYTGQAQLRALFTEQVGEHIRFDTADRHVVGDTETHTGTVSRDDWRRLGIAWLDATAEVVVQAGKIRSFTVTFSPDSVARLQAAQARAGTAPPPAPAQLPSALPRTGEALSPVVALPVVPLLAAGAASLLAGLALLRRR